MSTFITVMVTPRVLLRDKNGTVNTIMSETPNLGYFKRLFWDKKFFHYTWIGVFISVLNVFFLWLFIDVFLWPTVLSSIVVVFGNFIGRYILMDLFSVVG